MEKCTDTYLESVCILVKYIGYCGVVELQVWYLEAATGICILSWMEPW